MLPPNGGKRGSSEILELLPHIPKVTCFLRVIFVLGVREFLRTEVLAKGKSLYKTVLISHPGNCRTFYSIYVLSYLHPLNLLDRISFFPAICYIVFPFQSQHHAEEVCSVWDTSQPKPPCFCLPKISLSEEGMGCCHPTDNSHFLRSNGT